MAAIFLAFLAVIRHFDELDWNAVTAIAAIIAILYSSHSFSVSTMLTRQSNDQNVESLRLTREAIDISIKQLTLAEEGLTSAKNALAISRQQLVLSSAPLLSLEATTDEKSEEGFGEERYLLQVSNLGTGIARNVHLTYERTQRLTNLRIEKERVSAAIAPSRSAEFRVNYEFLTDILEGTEFKPGAPDYVDQRTLKTPHTTVIATIRIDYDDIHNHSYSTYVNFERVHYPFFSENKMRHQYRMVDYRRRT
jgi:hypothetical protein